MRRGALTVVLVSWVASPSFAHHPPIACAEPETTPPASATEPASQAYQAGRYDEAAATYSVMADDPTQCRAARLWFAARHGLALRRAGRLEHAARVLELAVSDAEAAGASALAARAKRYLGRTWFERGERARAARLYDEAETYHAVCGPRRELVADDLEQAALQIVGGDHAAAQRAYRSAILGADALDDSTLAATARQGLGIMLKRVGQFGHAAALLGQAANDYDASGQTARAAETRLTAASIALVDDRLAAAAAAAGGVLDAGPHGGVIGKKARLVEGYALLWSGAARAAASAAEVGLTLASPYDDDVWRDALELLLAEAHLEAGDLPKARDGLAFLAARASGTPLRQHLATVEARTAASQGATDAAIAALESYVATAEALRPGYETSMLDTFYRPHVRRAHESLLSLYVDEHQLDAALGIAARLKARMFATRVTQRRGQQIEHASERFDGARLRRHIPDDVTVIDYYVLPTRLVIATARTDEIAVQTVDVDEGRLADAVSRFSAALARGDAPSHEISQWLSEVLLRPIRRELTDRARAGAIAFSPHGVLHELPFAALPWPGPAGTDETLLVDHLDSYEVPGLMSLRALDGLRGPPCAAAPAVVAVGDPNGDLAGAYREALHIEELFPTTTVLTGRKATKSALFGALIAADVFHFSGHARVHPRTGAPFLEVAEGDDGDDRIAASELEAMTLRMRLVNLSACGSAGGVVASGDERRASLTRAFMSAGADAVMSVRWPLDDEASRVFNHRFYGSLRRLGRLRAFADARRHLRQTFATERGDGRRPTRGEAQLAARRRFQWAAFHLSGRLSPNDPWPCGSPAARPAPR